MEKSIIIAEIATSDGNCNGCFILNILKNVDKQNYNYYGDRCPLYDLMCGKTHTKFLSISKDEYNDEIVSAGIAKFKEKYRIGSSYDIIDLDKEKLNIAKDIFFKQLSKEYALDDIIRGIVDNDEIHKYAEGSVKTADIFVNAVADKLLLKKNNK